MSKQSSSSSGIGFTGLLTIAFIVLKLTNYIDWSWWWVLSPIWGYAAIVIVLLIITAIIEVKIEDSKPAPREKPSKWEQKLKEMQEAQKRREDKP